MAENGQRTKKSKDADGVLGSLPTSRPNRMSRRSREQTSAAAPPAAGTATKPKPKAKPPAAKATAKRAPAAKPAAKPEPPKLRTAPGPTAADKPRRPRAVRAGSPALKDSSSKANERRDPVSNRSPSGPEIAATVVQAAGELAQIGLTVGGQILKRAVDKLPKR